MSTIFPLSASVGQIFQGYQYDGTLWNIIGVDLTADYPEIIDGKISASVIPNDFATVAYVDQEIGNIDLSSYLTASVASATYLTQANASTTYATKIELQNIDLSSASAAAVAAIVDSAPETLNTLNELAAALGDDANYASTITTALGTKLNASTASTTYLTQASASSTYLAQVSASTTYALKNNPEFTISNVQQLNTNFVETNGGVYTSNGHIEADMVWHHTNGDNIGDLVVGDIIYFNGSDWTATPGTGFTTGTVIKTPDNVQFEITFIDDFTSTARNIIVISVDVLSGGAIGGYTESEITNFWNSLDFQFGRPNPFQNGVSAFIDAGSYLISSTEIGYLDGITSGIQSQLDSKLSSASASTTYLTQSDASTVYLTQATASSTYLTQVNASTTYARIIDIDNYVANSFLLMGG